MVRSACETPMAKCELDYDGNRTPTARFEWYYGGRTSTGGFECCDNDKTPTSRYDLANMIMGDLQRVKGTMVSKECQVIQIAIYIRVKK